MKTTFLEYYKTLLCKMSFDKNLLMKEFTKAMQNLKENERKYLKNWMQINFKEIRVS